MRGGINLMSILIKLKRAIMNPEIRFGYLSALGFYNKMSDQEYIRKYYKIKTGKDLQLENPVTFNEKLQWLKLHDHNPLYTRMADKYESKIYFAEKIGDKYIIPTIGVYDDFDDINFDQLPNKFVLKTTHDSGGVIICKDKKSFDVNESRKKTTKWLKRNYYYNTREWPYKNIKPRLIIEEYLDAMDSVGLVEYKIFCFNGKPGVVLVCKGNAHGNGRTNDFFDIEFNHLPVKGTYPNSKDSINKPEEYNELLTLASKLSVGIPQVRVDFYVADGKIYIGETTFYHDAGCCLFDPPEWDMKFGKMIDLTGVKNKWN